MSRKVFDSAIWKKPPQYYRLLSWLIGRAVFRNGCVFKGHTLKRGELITTYGEIANALSYRLNRATIKPTLKELRIMLLWMQSEGMILLKPLTGGTLPNKGRPKGFTRAYLGLLITVVNYNTYQDTQRYKGRPKGGTESEQGQIEEECIKEECITPRDFYSEISALKERYSDQETIDQAFDAIQSTRKTNRIADSVKLSTLQSWERYPVETVVTSIKTYLDKCYHRQGKNEKYLLGIIRNSNGTGTNDAPEGKTMKSTGSPTLDEHYRGQGYRIT